jgi:TonB family protein
MNSDFKTSTQPSQINLTAIFTLIVWLGCLSVSLLGMLYPLPTMATTGRPEQEPTEVMNVETFQGAEAPQQSPPPPQQEDSPVPSLPALPVPSPAIAFAQPIDNSVPIRTQNLSSVSPIAVQQLTFGQGEGDQPDPEYPLEAQLNQEEGTVQLLLHVEEDGRVSSVEVTQPSPWPLLNQSAVRAARDTWRFRPGPRRNYQIAITFQINRH